MTSQRAPAPSTVTNFSGEKGARPHPSPTAVELRTGDNESTFSPSHCHIEGHSIPTTSGSAASASRFDALPLCAFASLRCKGVGSNAETPRRKDAERTWPRGGCLDRSAARDPREPEREIVDG